MAENEYVNLFDRIKEAFGDLPILHVIETVYMVDNDREYVWEPTKIYTIDLGKFNLEEDGYELRYVSHIIDACLSTNHARGSRKYSFGDTPQWWDKFKPDDSAVDRRHVNVIYDAFV